MAIESSKGSADRIFQRRHEQTREEFGNVRNNHRHFVSLVASRISSRSDIRRNFACIAFGRRRRIRDSTFDGPSGSLMLEERESFC